ncbi:MAG: helix-turn-helix domain-containing protein [Lachnospiraceae bacterium]|nr:helix-turn-helix domain-containing protein [Lachnospiraceae bacterium]
MYREVIQDSLDYIEDNIKCEISARELSERAGFSLFHYYRLFQMTVGMPVMQYILRRRLLNAIYEISCGNKMIDAALLYGFETHAGFYKAFVREFGCTPTQYLKRYKVKKPYRINVFKEEHIMVTHKKATQILKNWGLENEKLSDIYYDGSGNRNENAFYVGTDYVLKFSPHLGKLKSHITISKALENVGLFAATPVETLDGKEYIAEGELYFCLTKRLEGQQIKTTDMYEDDFVEKARFVGEVIGQLSNALAGLELLVKDTNIYESVVNLAIPKLKGKLDISEDVFLEYTENFGKLIQTLPKQVIHRDPNLGNIIVGNNRWGFIDFELCERNVRIFDPCYAATAILSESFEAGNETKLWKWLQIYKNIIYGYDTVVKLTEEEKEAIPYVVLSNQLLALAWFDGKEKYQELYKTNKMMTEWLVSVFNELRDNCTD